VRVVIDNAALRRHRSCKGAYTSPYWDEREQALVYEDWASAVKFFLETADGTARLQWLAKHKLVPMTMDEFIAARAARGASNE
jgi:hypothetical protein